MDETANLRIGDQNHTLPLIIGTREEVAIDIRNLRAKTGCITYDDGYSNTGSCSSEITFIDGEKGILCHRGYAIEELAKHSNFLELAYLVIYGELPSQQAFSVFQKKIIDHSFVHENMQRFWDVFPESSHPMAMLSGMLNGLGCYYPKMSSNNREQDLEFFDETTTLLISKIRTLAAMSYRMKRGLPIIYPDKRLSYCDNFLHMLFSEPYQEYEVPTIVSKALDTILLLHVDHEQNCSTSTVRMVASSGANMFACVCAGVCALWGPLHGGANMGVIRMLQDIYDSKENSQKIIEKAKLGQTKLMGFGHRVYKSYDPRAIVLRKISEELFSTLKISDPLLDIAQELEAKALQDPYFIERKLYPNVDFYSGILLRAIGIPLDMFTVIFAMGRIPGWLANWLEVAKNSKGRIYRPRQIYQGKTLRAFVPITER